MQEIYDLYQTFIQKERPAMEEDEDEDEESYDEEDEDEGEVLE